MSVLKLLSNYLSNDLVNLTLSYAWDNCSCLKSVCYNGNYEEAMKYKGYLYSVYYSSRGGHFRLAKELLEGNEKFRIVGLAGACKNNNMEIAKYMLADELSDKHSDINFAFGKTCSGGHINMIKLVLDNIPNIDINIGFVLACKHGHRKVIDYLISIVDAQNWRHYFNTCCRYNQFELSKFMLSKIIDLDDGENLGQEYYGAAHYGRKDVLEYMISMENTDLNWSTIFMGSCEGEDNIDIIDFAIKKMLKHGYQIQWQYGLNNTLFWGNINKAKYIINKALEKTGGISFDWEIALKNACLSADITIIQYIISKIKEVNWDSNHVIHWDEMLTAACSDYCGSADDGLKIAELLLGHGASYCYCNSKNTCILGNLGYDIHHNIDWNQMLTFVCNNNDDSIESLQLAKLVFGNGGRQCNCGGYNCIMRHLCRSTQFI